MSDDPEVGGGDASAHDLDALGRPGLHELVVDDAAQEAARLAEALGGESVEPDHLEAMIERRERALANGLTGGAGGEHGEHSVRVLADIDGLRALAKRLASAERMHVRTNENMVEAVGQRVTGGGLAVHPDSIRRSADDVLVARREVDEIEAELAALEAAGAVVAEEVGEVDDEIPARSGRLAPEVKRRIAGVIVGSIGIAIMAGAVLAAFAGAVAVVVLVVPIVAIWWGVDQFRRDRSDVEDERQASSNLASIAARTDAVFGDTLRPDDLSTNGIPASSSGRLKLVEGRLDLARERLRSAEGAWTDLAGSGADPTDVEHVLRDRDPQYFAAIEMVAQTSQSRASAAHLRRVAARWKVIWSALDREPPAPGEAEAAVDALAGEGVRAVRVATRGRVAAEPGSDATRPLVLVDLRDDVSDELIERLAALADTTPVIVLSER